MDNTSSSTLLEAPIRLRDPGARSDTATTPPPGPDLNAGGPDVPNLTRAEKIQSKEDAVKEALTTLRHIRTRIGQASVQPTGLDFGAWSLKLEELEQEYGQFQYLIGVAGDTGLGKTSLINALLNPLSDIAPASQSGACTAAVCCFEYHEPTDINKTFLAVARFKTKDMVDKELAAFFEELKEFENAVAPQDTQGAVYRGELVRFHSTLELISGWSGLQVANIRELGLNNRANEITTECRESIRFFNLEAPGTCREEHVHHAKAPDFLKLVKPFVGASRQKAQIFWPLVEVVHFYLKVDNFLRNNITLVDLPGEMDALESRSKVAQSYYQKLDQLIVVTSSDRAADNRTAMDLLRDDQILDLEADGKTKSLCVVITKIDLLDWVSFVENEWTPHEISPDFPALKAHHDNLLKRVNRLKRATDNGQTSSYMDSDGDDEESDDDLRSAFPELLLAQRKTLEHELALVKSKCLRKCIEARSNDSKTRLQQHFDMVRNIGHTESVPTQLNLFPVSSYAHKCLLKYQALPGFPDSDATGIRPLEAWLTEESLTKREDRSDALLRRIRVLFDTIHSWVQQRCDLSNQLPAGQFASIKSELQRYNEMTKHEIERHQCCLDRCVTNLLSNAASLDDTADRTLAEGFVSHVRTYEKDENDEELHWATYMALIRRYGAVFYTKTLPRKKRHSWQQRIYTYYLTQHNDAWRKAFREELPKYPPVWCRVLAHVKTTAMRRVSESVTLPSIYIMAYERERQRVLNIHDDHQSRSLKAIDDFRKKCLAIRKRAWKFLRQEMRKGYEEAKKISGRGASHGMKLTMGRYACRVQDVIFVNVSRKIREEMKQAQIALADKHRALNNELLSSLSAVQMEVAQSVCLSDRDHSRAMEALQDLEKFKDTLHGEIFEWEKTWLTIIPLLQVQGLDGQGRVTEGLEEIQDDDESVWGTLYEGYSRTERVGGITGQQDSSSLMVRPQKRIKIAKD